MSINYVTSDVLKQKFSKPTLIIHVCNDRDGFGSGFAGAVAKKYPEVKAAYHDWYRVTETQTITAREDSDEVLNPYDTEFSQFTLGEIQLVKVNDTTYVVNMLSQSKPGGETFNIGPKSVYLRPIRLDSLRQCLYNVAVWAKRLNAQVVGPKFGSGLSKGKWDEEIVPLIEECLCGFDIPVTIYTLE